MQMLHLHLRKIYSALLFLVDFTLHQKKMPHATSQDHDRKPSHPTTDFSSHFPLSKWIR